MGQKWREWRLFWLWHQARTCARDGVVWQEGGGSVEALCAAECKEARSGDCSKSHHCVKSEILYC